MGTRREELSTADLAGQPPTRPQRSEITEEEADLAHDDRADAADRTIARAEDDVARAGLAPEDHAPEDLARDDLAGEPALTGDRPPDLATDVEPGEQPMPRLAR